MDDHIDPHDPVASFTTRNMPPDTRRWKTDGRRDYRAEWHAQPYGSKVAVWIIAAMLLVGMVWPFLVALTTP